MRRRLASVSRTTATAIFVSLFAAAAAPAATAKPPVAAKRPVENRYFGTTVRDDYQWMEDWNDPATRAWVEGENAYTRATLDPLPARAAIRERVTELTRDVSPGYATLRYAGHTLFALKDQPPKNQPMLVVLPSVDDLSHERVLVDPNAIDTTGSTTIDFYVPSLDGSKVAVSLSRGGTESGDVHLYDVATGRELRDVLPKVNGGTAGGSVAWTADGNGLFYTRYPAPGERPAAESEFWQQAWFHSIGGPRSADTPVLKDLPKIAEIEFRTTDDGKWLLILVRNGDGGEIGWWLRGPDGTLHAVAGFKDRIVGAEFGGADLLLLSRAKNANGEVLRVPLANADLAHATSVVPASETAIDGIFVAGDYLYIEDIVGGPNEVRVVRLDGTSPSPQFRGGPPDTDAERVPLPSMSAINGFCRWEGQQCLIEVESWTEPSRWLRWDPDGENLKEYVDRRSKGEITFPMVAPGKLSPTALAMKSAADFSDIEVRREFAVSKDGTKVPISILVRKGTALDGRAPALLYGYGGYGISQRPNFQPRRKLWLEQGGVWAVAHIRGGREYGDAWHEAGMLTKKQNVFDDFAACAQKLVDDKYTSPERLAILGGSNGGLLMGAELTQHPSLFGAVVSEVGVYDMLRVELSPNGLFNTTEYGSVKDSAQFRALRSYSPYANVHDGTQYPATLLLTGANDPRVEPSNSFKFAARLQASGTTRPVLLRTSMNTGHIGTPLSARNEQYVDIFSFLFSQLGVTYRRAAPTP